MGLNEILLLTTGVVSTILVYGAWKFDKERLYGIIVIFLILISVVGAKIVTYFGFETNTGNIFYAATFLATYFLIERYGKRQARRSIWIGVIGVVAFSILLQLAVQLVGSESTEALNEILVSAFGPSVRLAVASLLAYVVSQTINVNLYIYIRQHFPQYSIWVRANISNLVAQVVDSLIFFSVAFLGTIEPDNVTEVILTGLVIKVVYMMLASPLLYQNKMETEEDGNGNTVSTVHR